ncbi:T9SS type A sorting domain-containing protein [Chryseobacterium indoltheticum]|uniref:Por secretion system C-terminal sorting domain n=1 Tax=Chryseobacterium indoltheticum TaxID=254 RepID=A0A381F9F3_9FLAO|nr:T9SS type A sorting domain-containing protein [Chryseobacterium indoltheticum]AZA73342.1 T9SS C-terminal target domain-containing protein [Chryseobacterium indoltheticum]SIR30548.1 Por secretion system C-terminal sorting domain-containing protein [Chryseobacterium indoltheticum]SUX43137.1 Por secretion system C-terminal sorting domain [Chryseobacterium indoltheticum]
MKTKLFSKFVSKRTYLAIAVLGISFMNAQITTFPWTETFEDNSPTRASWTQIYEVNNMSWTFASTASTGGTGVTAYEGTKFANYPGTSHNFDKTKLVSPVLNLSGVNSPTVSFYYINKLWGSDQNWLRVFYRTSATAAWVQLAEFHSNITAWTSSGSIGLPPTTYQIAIECETDYGYSTLVDALVVSGANLSVSDVKKTVKSSISYYPNPAQNVLNYKSSEKVSQITVYNSVGQKIQSHKTDSDQGRLDVSALPSGTYIVTGETALGTETFKMIKK